MKKLIFACSVLVGLASCSGNSTTGSTDSATLEEFSKITGIQAVLVDTAMYYYSPEYRFQGVAESVTVDNITTQSEDMRAQFREDMSKCKPFEIFTVIGEKDTVHLRYCRGYDEYGSDAKVLKPVNLDKLYVAAEKFEAVLEELSK